MKSSLAGEKKLQFNIYKYGNNFSVNAFNLAVVSSIHCCMDHNITSLYLTVKQCIMKEEYTNKMLEGTCFDNLQQE